MIFTRNGVTYRVGHGWLYRAWSVAEVGFKPHADGYFWTPFALLQAGIIL